MIQVSHPCSGFKANDSCPIRRLEGDIPSHRDCVGTVIVPAIPWLLGRKDQTSYDVLHGTYSVTTVKVLRRSVCFYPRAADHIVLAQRLRIERADRFKDGGRKRGCDAKYASLFLPASRQLQLCFIIVLHCMCGCVPTRRTPPLAIFGWRRV